MKADELLSIVAKRGLFIMATIEAQANIALTKADCSSCLTRSCPMNGSDNSPVNSCNIFRQANCAFCAIKECSFNGTINSPVLSCSSFKLLGAA